MQICHAAARVAALTVATLTFAPRPAPAATLPLAPVALETFEVGSLHVERFGSGKTTLVLVPGLASGTWTWYGTIAHESPTYTIYAVTLPGFDGRPRSADASLFDAFDRDLTALLATRRIAAPIVIGHSLGGTLAIAYAETHSASLGGLVAVDGMPVFPPFAGLSAEQRNATATQLASALAASTPSDLLARAERYQATIGLLDASLVEPTATEMAKSDPHAEAEWLREDLSADFRPGLAGITVPFDEIMPYTPAPAASAASYTLDQTKAFYAALLAGAPTARVVPIDRARHYAMLDRPEAFYAAIDAFLAALPAP